MTSNEIVQIMGGQYLNKMPVTVAAIPLVYAARAWTARLFGAADARAVA